MISPFLGTSWTSQKFPLAPLEFTTLDLDRSGPLDLCSCVMYGHHVANWGSVPRQDLLVELLGVYIVGILHVAHEKKLSFYRGT